jgi:hypothetical protein
MQVLKARLSEALDCAEKAVSKEREAEFQSSHDTEPAVDPALVPKPVKTTGKSVGDALLKGGRERTRAPISAAAQLSAFEKTKHVLRRSPRARQ